MEQLHKYEVLLLLLCVVCIYTQQGRNGCHYSSPWYSQHQEGCLTNHSITYLYIVGNNVQTDRCEVHDIKKLLWPLSHFGHVHCVNTLSMYIHVYIVSHMYIHIVLCVR